MVSVPDFRFNGYLFSFDQEKLPIATVHRYLSEESYWAPGITEDRVKTSLMNSICLGIYDQNGLMAGFGRMVTDQATFGYLADVFVLKEHQGQGLAKKLVACFCQLADDFGLRRLSLATKDAQGLYRPFGFTESARPDESLHRKGVNN